MYKGKVYVLNSNEMKNVVLKEMHNVPYAGHLGYQKTITTMNSNIFGQERRKKWLII
jgi:hypothetical protein